MWQFFDETEELVFLLLEVELYFSPDKLFSIPQPKQISKKNKYSKNLETFFI